MSLQLPCGCIVDIDHHAGDRLVVCDGGGRGTCPGGRAYTVTARPSRNVLYTATARTVPTPDEPA